MQKGLDLILEALRQLDDLQLNKKLRVIFAGPEVANSFEVIESSTHSLRNIQIDLLGPVGGVQKAKLFEEAHFFLHPSRFEGMARAAREAVASGLLVIASEESNFGTWTADYKLGFTTRLTTADLTQQIVSSTNMSSEAYLEICENCKNFSYGHTWNAVAKNFYEQLKIYSNIKY